MSRVYSAQPIDGLKGVVHVAAGVSHNAVITSDGSLHQFGWGENGRLGNGGTGDEYIPRVVAALAAVRVVNVSAGGAHTVAITSTGCG
jgi:alpha-tubulin suppressor-like RCC1 family protein